MTTEQLRSHPEYTKCMDRIKSYHPGFTFTMDYTQIPTRAKQNGMRAILRDAIKLGYLECTQSQISLSCEITAETFRRTEVETNA